MHDSEILYFFWFAVSASIVVLLVRAQKKPTAEGEPRLWVVVSLSRRTAL